jgi:hypothetical protein
MVGLALSLPSMAMGCGASIGTRLEACVVWFVKYWLVSGVMAFRRRL